MPEPTTTADNPKTYSTEAIRRMCQERREKMTARESAPPVVTAVVCGRSSAVTLTFSSGCAVSIPLSEFHELAGATPAELRDVTVIGSGGYIEWPRLDMTFEIGPLLLDLLGLKPVSARILASRAGSARSEAKAAASRTNGHKGGRPRKPRVVQAEK